MEFNHSTPLPDGWTMLSLKSVCKKITSGGTPSRKHPEFYEGGTIPWVKTKELNDSWIYDTEEHITDEALNTSSAKLLPRNTILLAMYGATVAQLGILAHEMTCNQASCALIADEEKAYFRFLFYLLLAHRKMIKSLSVGAAQQNLSAKQIKKFSFRFPPFAEQRAIAHILGTLDDKIELNRQMNETLEAMAQALFKSWFVDFDPVVVNAIRAGNPVPDKFACRAAHYRDNPAALGLPEETLRLFPDRFTDSDLGPIPDGWETVPLEWAFDIQDGKPLPKSKRIVDGQYQVFGANGPIARTDEVLIHSPCIVLGKIGSCGALHRSDDPCWVTNNAFIVKGGQSRSLEFAWFSLKLIDFKGFVGGSANPYMPKKNFAHYKIVLPASEVVESFQKFSGSIRTIIRDQDAQKQTLVALRDTLLPKLISSELRVPDAEKLLEKAI